MNASTLTQVVNSEYGLGSLTLHSVSTLAVRLTLQESSKSQMITSCLIYLLPVLFGQLDNRIASKSHRYDLTRLSPISGAADFSASTKAVSPV